MTFVNSVDVTMVNDDLLSSDHDLPNNGTLGTNTSTNATTITISVTDQQEYDPLVFWSVNAFILTLLVTVCVWCQFCGGNECLLKLNRRDLSELEYATRQQQQRQLQNQEDEAKKEPPEERRRRLVKCFERTQVLMVVEDGDYQEHTEMPCGHDLSSQPCLLDDDDSLDGESLDEECMVPASTLLAAAAARHGGSTAAYLVAGMASASALDVPEAAIVPSPTGRTRLGSSGGAKVDGDARRDYMPRAPLGDGADTGADARADVVDAGVDAGEERSGEKVRLHVTKCAVEHEEERAADKVELDLLSRMEQGHCDTKQSNNCRSTIMPKEPVGGSSELLHPTSTTTRGEPAGGAKLLVEFSAQDRVHHQQVSVTEEPSHAHQQDSVVAKTSSLHLPALAATKKPDLPEEEGGVNGPFMLSPEEPDEAHQSAEALRKADDEHDDAERAGRAAAGSTAEDFTTSAAEHLEDAGQKFGYLILRRRALQSSCTSSSRGGASSGGCSMIVGKTPNCCAVCLAPYEVGEKVVWSNQNDVCPHAFHLDCILDWLVKTQNGTPCPCCRQEFTTALEPYRSNDDDDKDNSNSNSTSNNRMWHMTEVF